MKILFAIYISLSILAARELTTYDYEDIRQISRLADMAYQDGSKYLSLLLERNWVIENLSLQGTDDFFVDSTADSSFMPSNYVSSSTYIPVGIRAQRGNLLVIAYAGTQGSRVPDTLRADFRAFKSDLSKLSNLLDMAGYVHGGILEYYLGLKNCRLPNLLEGATRDTSIIITGHSLGAALGEISLVDYYAFCCQNNIPQSWHRMSLLTIAAPPILSSEMVGCFNSWFPGTSHLRLYLDGDAIPNLTRSGYGIGCESDSSVFQHAGMGIKLRMVGVFEHSVITYIRKIDRRNGDLIILWPERFEDLTELATDRAMAQVKKIFSCSEFITKIEEKLRKKLSSEQFLCVEGWYLNDKRNFIISGNIHAYLNLACNFREMIDESLKILESERDEKNKRFIPFEEDLQGDLDTAHQKAQNLLAALSGLGAFGM